MRSQVKCRVVGVYASGERVVLTTNTTREIAEKIVNLMLPGSAFDDLRIETDDDGTATTDD